MYKRQPYSSDSIVRRTISSGHLNSLRHVGQTSTHLDSLFTGGFLGTKADISDGSLRHDEFRTYNNIVGDYYVAPRFLMRVAMHTAKNYLADHLRSVKVPLILGIWGTFPFPLCRGSSCGFRVSAVVGAFDGW